MAMVASNDGSVAIKEIPHGIFFWLANACKVLREQSNVKLSAIAGRAGKDQSAIYRFEKCESFPRDIETLVAVYAELCHIKSPHLLWADALAHWGRAEGVGDFRDVVLGDTNHEADPDLAQRVERLEEVVMGVQRAWTPPRASGSS